MIHILHYYPRILDDDFHFEIPEEEYDTTNVLQDQGYNPTGRSAEK